MKPFDLEAAKRGEPIEVVDISGTRWTQVRFIKVHENGSIVYEGDKDSFNSVAWRPEQFIRMAKG